MRIVIVDDTIAYRSQLRAVLSQVPGVEIVATAANGKIALQKIEQNQVDLVILDIEMPEMDGIETVRELKSRGYRDLKIIMFSSLNRSAVNRTFEAIKAGANDVVAKPDSSMTSMESAIEHIKSELVPKINQFWSQRKDDAAGSSAKSQEEPSKGYGPKKNLATFLPRLIVIASSTGGPQALEELFEGIGGPYCPPILIVQHMPPVFTKMLAERLNKLSGFQFVEASEGQKVERGHVYIAPGDYHMEVVKGGDDLRIALNQGPKENSVRPAADVLFRSAVRISNRFTFGIVLTGMGEDGLIGARAIKEVDGGVFIQDKASCVVWGMPAAVHRANAYDQMGKVSECRELLNKISGG